MIDSLPEAERSQEIQEKEIKKPLHFRREVTIKGLNYVFEGDIPQEPTDFEWSVSVPNWQEQEPKFKKKMKKGEIDPFFSGYLEGHKLGGGRVGFLKITKVEPPDKSYSVGIDMIESQTVHLPKEFGYNQAEGIGSFLLDNLCTLTDLKKWKIYIEPMDKGGKLSQSSLYQWYKKRGFEHAYKFPKETHDSFGGMQRQPRMPDESQVILNILRSKTPVK